jgi:hypothetical protein
MSVIEAVLAVIGLLTLVGIGVAGWWPEQPEPEQVAEVDRAAPYREGLHAAMRIQTAAQDLEQQLYVEAMRQAGSRADVLDARPERDTL